MNDIMESILGLRIFTPISITIAICLTTIVIYFFTIGDPLSSIPGPLSAHFSRLWLIKHSRAGDMHRVSIALHKKYGKLVRTGPKEVSTNDLTAIKTIYGVRSNFRKSDWYSVWQGLRKFDLFAERDEHVHSSQRRLVSQVYSLKSFSTLESSFDQVIHKFLQKMADFSGKPVNMTLWAQLFAFDVVGQVTFSQQFGFMDRGADDGSFENIDDTLRSAAWIGQVPWLFWLHHYVLSYIGITLGVGARHGRLRSFAGDEIAARKTKSGNHHDMLSQLNDVHQQKPVEFSENDMLSMATSNVFAGSDTTAISICSVLYHLCKFPKTKTRLMAEIESIRNAELFQWADGDAKDKYLNATLPIDVAMKRMPYLQACLHEALRLHPAVGMTLPRVVPEGGIMIDGHHIPAGTTVGANPWVIHRDKTVFGDDVEAFRPERWIEGDEKTRGDMERYFFAFGAGARGCIGRNLSWIEMSKMIPLLLLNFDIQIANEDGEAWHEHCSWFVKQEGFNVRLTPRE